MGESKREQLIAMLDNIDKSPAAKQDFLDSPIAVINKSLNLGLDDHISRTPVANKLLIAALKDEDATSRLQETTARYQAGDIDLTTARATMADTLIDAAAQPGSEEWLKALKDSLRPPVDPSLLDPALAPEKFDPQAIAIPNIAAAVDIVVVVTEAAIVNSEAFFSGRGRNDAMDIRRIARTLGRDG
jgi:hypothetical protein